MVANNNRRIKDLYLIPLASKDPLPSKLLPFDGPGKHLEGILEILLILLGVVLVIVISVNLFFALFLSTCGEYIFMFLTGMRAFF